MQRPAFLKRRSFQISPLLVTLAHAACATLPPERKGAVDIGYGEVDESHVGGSVETVEPESDARMQTLADMLRELPGVQASVNGDDIIVRIRGGSSSFLLSGQPLIVVDGMEYRGPLRGIDPSDIETLRVLKNAGETAVYGARGANGVILIATKNGNGTALKGVERRSPLTLPVNLNPPHAQRPST